jgi:hypothetical protein
MPSASEAEIDAAIERVENALARMRARKQPIVSVETETHVAKSLARLMSVLRVWREGTV